MRRRNVILSALSAITAIFVSIAVVAAADEPKAAKHEPAQASKKVRVVSTLFPFADWTRRIGGKHVEVTCLLPPGGSPHTYELTPRDVKAIQAAQLLISNGMGLDDWVTRLIKAASNKHLQTLVLADNFPTVPATYLIESGDTDNEHKGHGHGRHHDRNLAGCGMWLDPMRAARMVDLIAQKLSLIDPAHADEYRSRANRYWSQLDRIDRLYRRRLATLDGGFIAFHESFVYLFHRYGVKLYGVVEPYPGKEPSVHYIRKLKQRVQGRPLIGVLTEPQLSDKAAKVLADELKTSVIRVDPIGGERMIGHSSYIALMMHNLNQLAPKPTKKRSGNDKQR